MAFKKYTEGKIKSVEEYMECSCGSSEHLVKFSFDLEDGDLCLEVHLSNTLPFFKRVWHALKYIFGYKCKYGDFDEIIFKDEDVDRLIELLRYHRRVKSSLNKK